MIEVTIAPATEIAVIVDLFHKIDLHYFAGQAPSRAEISRYVRRSLFRPNCGVRVAVAKDGRKTLGLATFAILYPAPRMTGQLFMKDLFTVREARGKGVGRKIMQFLAKLAIKENCSRFDWTAEKSNPGALQFYDRLNIPRVEDKVYYRLTGDSLRDFARGRTPNKALVPPPAKQRSAQ